ncbi:MAG TPA: hypothetical protein VF491_13760 [Vicinamibacterales bacterium]|jgi:hypothetical protein
MKPSRAQELAVLRSVVYASLFDYPLTLEQLHRSLVGIRADAGTIAGWWRSSELLQATVEHRDGWYFPAGRRDLLATRARREDVSRSLLERDRSLLTFLCRIPFVRMVALSGSLAHLNAEGTADLDLFVITAPGRVWSVTVAVLVIARLLGWRRRLCLNYVISERAMDVAPPDLFSANQIIHLRPLAGQQVFERFVGANAFVRDFYPNFEVSPRPQAPKASEPDKPSERVLSFAGAPVFERVSRALYGWYLRRGAARWQSRDQVRLEPECLKLHTRSHRASTMRRFDAAMAEVLSCEPALAAPPR